MIKALVVDDSPSARELVVHILSRDPEIVVVGTASNGEEAIEAIQVKNPDVVTMDIYMPNMDGFQATQTIMETCPVPIIIVSGVWRPDEVAMSFRAMEAGALSIKERPPGIGHSAHEAAARELIRTVKLMSEVKVVRRWPQLRRKSAADPGVPREGAAAGRVAAQVDLVAIGASTGGPTVIKSILSELPKDFPAPLLIVQHIDPGFTEGFKTWLDQSSALSVRIAVNDEHPLGGHAYLSPPGLHLGVTYGGLINLSDGDPENGIRPSVSHLFRSVAKFFGKRAVGVLLTGMGKDGSAELKLMKDRGSVTIAQDKDSCVVHGMPGEAIRIDGASYIYPPERIVPLLMKMVNYNKKEQLKH